MQKRIFYFLVLGLSMLLLLSSCRTIREMKSFARCEFRLKDISQMDIAGKSMLSVNNLSDFNLQDAAQMATAFQRGSLPLSITFRIEVRNPHDKLAAMERLDWFFGLDKQQVVSGNSSYRVEVAPNGGQAIFPVNVQLDARQLLEKESLASIINLLSSLKGNNIEDSRLSFNIKPRFRVAGVLLGYPGYIRVGKNFTAKADAPQP